MMIGMRVLIPTAWPTELGSDTKLLPGVISEVWGTLVVVKVDDGYSVATNPYRLQLLPETVVIEVPRNGGLIVG